MERNTIRSNHELWKLTVQQARDAFVTLSYNLDLIFRGLVSYLEDNPLASPGDLVRTAEINESVQQLAAAHSQLSEIIKLWLLGSDFIGMTKEEIEKDVLIEMWINIEVLVLFLTLNKIDIQPYSHSKVKEQVKTLFNCNRLLS